MPHTGIPPARPSHGLDGAAYIDVVTTARFRLVLASASPARLNTLQHAGVEPTVVVSDVDEDAAVAEALERYGLLEPAQVALVLARAKAEAVAFGERVGDLVLGCDSVLEFDGQMHGKPADADEARARWRRMRGRHGVLHTGHWLVDQRPVERGGSQATLGATASTKVYFAKLTDEEIDAYVATGEPLRVAGAFTIDGLGGPFVTGLEGDHHNVVGISLPLLRELFIDIGVNWFDVVTVHQR